MILRSITLFLLVFLLFGCIYAEEIKIKNNVGLPIVVTIMAKEGADDVEVQGSIEHEIQTIIIRPHEEIVINLDKNKLKNSILLFKGITVASPPIIPIASNECTLNNCDGEVHFIQEDSQLICFSYPKDNNR